MFHAGGHKGVATRGMSSGLGRHYPHFLSHVDWKAPLRCGIIFCGISCLLSVVGVILTWLGIRRSVHDIFGESVPITGPILLAVGVLMLILALRQFCVAHMRKKAHNLAIKKKELGENTIAAIAEHEDEHDFNDDDPDHNINKHEDPTGVDDSYEKPPLIPGGYYDPEASEPINIGGYVWPPVPLQHPFYSMAMMIYKDPTLTFGALVTAQGLTETYSTGPVVATGTDMCERGDSSVPKAHGDFLSKQRDTAMLDTTSTTLQQSIPQTSIPGSRQECSKIFPADYLAPNQRKNTNVGINSLPNPTAFMMLRTLELQETI